MEKAPTKTGVFGGSFDPIHNGHIHAARAAMETFGLDQVLFIPARVSPHKTNTEPSAFSDRAEMVRLAIQSEPRFSCDTREGTRPGPSYTVDTLRELKEENPNQSLFLIIGTDQQAAFRRWHEPDEILSLATLAIIDRPAEAESSTEVRMNLKEGKEIRSLVPAAVSDYIQSRKLYQPCP